MRDFNLTCRQRVDATTNAFRKKCPWAFLGRHSYIGISSVVGQLAYGGGLSIGSFCCIGEGVTFFLSGGHRTDWTTTYPFPVLWDEAAAVEGHPTTRGVTHVGNDVWIGEAATILDGVTIGDGACVGTHALVSKDVPPYAIVGGNPAKIIRMRFDERTIQRFLKIAWWNWTDGKIAKYLPLMLSTDTGKFLDAAERRRG